MTSSRKFYLFGFTVFAGGIAAGVWMLTIALRFDGFIQTAVFFALAAWNLRAAYRLSEAIVKWAYGAGEHNAEMRRLTEKADADFWERL